jgi:hypothetical protein
MMNTKSSKIQFSAFLVFLGLCDISCSRAGEIISQNLNFVGELDLGAIFSSVQLSEDGKIAYLASGPSNKEPKSKIGFENESNFIITEYLFEQKKARSEVRISNSVQTMYFDQRTNSLFIAGSTNWNGVVSQIRYSSGTPRIGIAFTGNGLISPAVAVDAFGRLYISDINSGQVKFFPATAYLPADKAEALLKENIGMEEGTIFYSGKGGVSNIGVSGDGLYVFVTDARRALVSAVESGGKNAISDELGFEVNSGGPSVPFKMAVKSVTSRLSPLGNIPSKVPSLLLADYLGDRLIIADFNPLFATINTIAAGSINLPLSPGSIFEEGESPYLIDSDLEGKTILVGSKYSAKLVLFSRNGSALERIREFELRAEPIELDVSDNGSTALVLHKDDTVVTLITSNADGQTSKSVIDVTKSESVRELQRTLLNEFGFPVGAIDGMIGEKTRSAALAIERKYGVKLDLSDVDGTVIILRQLRFSKN